MINICLFASGRGSNAHYIFKSVFQGKLKKVKIVTLVCDNPQAQVLHIAKSFFCPTITIHQSSPMHRSHPNEEIYIEKILYKKNVNLICLAGYMRIIGNTLLNAFEGRIINIHPSLLPQYPGLEAQKRALQNGDTQSGCTIHLVDEGIDTGKILDQKIVDISPQDTIESLSKKILQEEHILYTKTLERISENFNHFTKTGRIL